MTTESRGREVVEGMLARDRFSAWLGLELVAVEAGACTCRMTVREEMVNGFGVSHGGVVFSLADSAFAFACNSSGFITVSIENSIRYPAAIHPGDVLTATVKQAGGSSRLGYFVGEVTNQNDKVVGLFTGTSYRTEKPHQ
jgi:acyl-CoA thioesterase